MYSICRTLCHTYGGSVCVPDRFPVGCTLGRTLCGPFGDSHGHADSRANSVANLADGQPFCNTNCGPFGHTNGMKSVLHKSSHAHCYRCSDPHSAH
jgi:hypothetical protein